MKRSDILDKAKEIVTKDRNTQYGDPEDNFRIIADLWNAYLGDKLAEVLNEYDVAILCALIKMARVRTSPEVEDHWVDLAGYAACGGECATNNPTDTSSDVESDHTIYHKIDITSLIPSFKTGWPVYDMREYWFHMDRGGVVRFNIDPFEPSSPGNVYSHPIVSTIENGNIGQLTFFKSPYQVVGVELGGKVSLLLFDSLKKEIPF